MLLNHNTEMLIILVQQEVVVLTHTVHQVIFQQMVLEILVLMVLTLIH